MATSRPVPGAAVRGDLGWRKLEERRENKKPMYGKRLEGLEDNRLVIDSSRKAEGCWKCGIVGRVWGVAEKTCDHKRGPC